MKKLVTWISIAQFCLLGLIFISCSQTTETPSEESGIERFDVELPNKPNILWIVTEDMGSYLPSFGDSTIVTPNLSRLAEEGVRYTHVFSPSGVCAPSRAAIATGMYPSSIGANHMRTGSYTEVTGLPSYEAVPPAEVKMLSEMLRSAGYFCTNNAKGDYQFKAPVTAWDEYSNEAHWRNRDTDQPFFAIFNFGSTHESGLFEPYNRPELVSKEIDFPRPPYLPNTEVVQRDLWKMYNNIAIMDQNIGKILDQLEEDGLTEETIIFFYADHGGPLPRQKRLVYDDGLRVPMIIRFPNRQKQGLIDNQLISFIDFVPTVLTLTGQQLPSYLQGQSFLGKNLVKRQYIHAAGDRFDAFTDVIRAVRDERYKLIKNYRPNQGYYLPVAYRERIPTMQELLRLKTVDSLDEIQSQWFRDSKPTYELFDCLSDPCEINNLADKPEFADKIEELSLEMDRWLSDIGDRPDLPERRLIDQLWSGGEEQPITLRPEIEISDGLIQISCKTEGASIGYRDASDTTASSKKTWKVYQQPINATSSDALEVVAHRIGFKPSEVVPFEW